MLRLGTKKLLLGCLIVVASSSLACASFVDQAVDKTVGVAADRVGERIGQKVGDAIAGAILADLEPAMMHIYTTSVFRMLFYHGGYYSDDLSSYEPGQYTKWNAKNVQEGENFERVLLRRRDDGSEWWRVESQGKDDSGKEVVLVMEALLAAPDAGGTRQIRRMRAKFPDEQEAREIPITEDNANQWILTNNRQLTQESLEGLTVNKAEAVTVPAGNFTARHVRVDGYDQQSKIDWYLVESVPGGMVRYTNTVNGEGGDENVTWDIVLVETGSGQTESKLGVDLDAVAAPAAEGAAAEAPAEGSGS